MFIRNYRVPNTKPYQNYRFTPIRVARLYAPCGRISGEITQIRADVWEYQIDTVSHITSDYRGMLDYLIGTPHTVLFLGVTE